MFKNIYKPEDYTIKGNPYKLRGTFLSKKDKLNSAAPMVKEESSLEKTERQEEQLRLLLQVIGEKESQLAEINKQIENAAGQAEIQARRIIENAMKEGEELKELKSKQGHDEGFDKGYFEGIEKGKEETSKKYASLIETMENITAQALSEKVKIIKNSEDDIVALSVDIAKKVVNGELKTNKEIVKGFVKEALLKLEDKEKVIVYCHPEDIEVIKSHRAEFTELGDIVGTLRIVPDEMLEQGECRLESKNEIIDTDINYQFGEIKKKLSLGE
ncbi:MAG: hypothetical protein CVV21_06345 [Candidatus Goldiibacteriota bacterium HGW-Goldbacteria-1]|nr:MAG: hypothetical protein CVV21_06345 [Candidatus Goldiibacteriota bacterium HGW-Goldbacteria-1]